MNKKESNMHEVLENYFDREIDIHNDKQVRSVLDMQFSILKRIAEMYVVMYLCDLETDSFVEIHAMDHVKKLLGSVKSAKKALELVVEHFVAPEFREEARRFNDMDTLAERMKGKEILSMDYNATIAGWCRQQFIPIKWDENGNVHDFICIEQRIHKEKMRVEKLKRQAELDGLTQLMNRSSGEEYINKHLAAGSQGMYCLFDVDNFKYFNDHYGHAVGDEILKNISICMKEIFRNRDVLVRIGGDELAIFAIGLMDRNVGNQKIAELRRRISERSLDFLPEEVSISVGVVYSVDYSGQNFDSLYQAADTLMYEQKRAKSHHGTMALPMEFSDEMPTAFLIYQADETEKILFASKKLVELFDCETLDEFMKYTKGSFKNIVCSEDLARVEQDILMQIHASGEHCIDHVFYRIISAKGNKKYIEDYGHLVDSRHYGHAYFVTLQELEKEQYMQLVQS